MNVVFATTYCIFINIIQIHTTRLTTRPQHDGTWQVPSTTIGPINSTKYNNRTELDRLVEQRESILQQIEEAIEDGKIMLRKTNGTININNLDNVQKLYKNLLSEDVHPSNETDDAVVGTSSAGSGNYTTVGAGGGGGGARRHKQMKLHLFDFVSLTNKKKKHKDKEKEKNRIIMQGKIDEWILNKELEKKKIKSYIDRIRMIKNEKCPRRGVSRKRKKSRTRRLDGDGEDEDDDEEARKLEAQEKEERRKKKKKKYSKYKGGKKYPCCRKCCKKSYLGCL